MRNPFRRHLDVLRAQQDVILSAKVVESGFEPHLEHQYDPDDLLALVTAVRKLRELEGQ